jgi:hypothetical protein
MTRLATDLFGSDILSSLSDEKKAFLGLIIKPLSADW